MTINGLSFTSGRRATQSLGRRREPLLRRLIEEYRSAKRRLAVGLAHGRQDYSVLTALAQEVGRAAARMRIEITSLRKLRKARHFMTAANAAGRRSRMMVLS